MAFNIILLLETSNSVREVILNGKTTAVQKLKDPLDGEFGSLLPIPSLWLLLSQSAVYWIK